jgi:hypothetical protein
MNDIIDFFQAHPFILGLSIGLMIAVFCWVKGLFRSMSLKKEIKQLKESVYTKMQLETKGQMAISDELGTIRKENENLRITVKSLQQKPGRAEIRQFHIYDKAIRTLLGKSPGFGPAWEMVLKEAEEEFHQTETGFRAFVRKVFSPQIPQQFQAKNITAIETKKSEGGQDS